MTDDIIVVGGGASGMMAAVTAGEAGASVVLLEKMEKPGRKINITGKGRCNITNDRPASEALAAVPGNSRFLFSAFTRFDSRAAMDFFEKHGLRLKTERGMRVFPASDSAYDVTDTLRAAMKRAGVRVAHATAEKIIVEDGRAVGVKCRGGEYHGKAIVLAVGGASYPGTGSTGDGYAMAEKVGHTVIAPKPSLVPLECAEACCARMQGLSLRNAALTVRDSKNKTVYEDFGEMLFTHFGVSGPMILSASAHMRDFGKDSYRLIIDLKPALSEEKLDARILRDISEQSNRDCSNLIAGLVNHSMVPVIAERAGIPADQKTNSITKAQRRALIDSLKRFTLTVTGTRPLSEAIVTAGGVKTSEIDPATMESKKVKGLYFAGELIDVDAYTGGFNLQIAWSTGRAAGLAAAEAVASEEFQQKDTEGQALLRPPYAKGE